MVEGKCIKQKLVEEFLRKTKNGLYALTQKMMAYNSNRIEGSTLTSEQTASLFDTGTITSNGIEVYKAKDIEEMQGHFKMFNQMLKYIEEPLSIELIKSYHYQLKNGVFEDQLNGYPIGEFKNRMNSVSDIKTTEPAKVEENIQALLNEYSNSSKKIEDIAKFHAKYELIHPFQDGNGRTGRMIILKQCLDNDIIPIIVKDDDKSVYYNALHFAQIEKDYSKLIVFFEMCQKQYLDIAKDFIIETQVKEPAFNPYIPEEKDYQERDILAEVIAKKNEISSYQKDSNDQDDKRNDKVEEQTVEDCNDIDEPTPGEE